VGGLKMNFKETVLYCFDNKEFRTNWERIRQRKLTNNPKAIKLFIKDIRNWIWNRIEKDYRKEVM
jgi:hypothetical protein